MFRRFFKNIFKTLSTLLIVLTCLSYLAPWVDPTKFRWLSFFGTAFPWLAVCNLLALLFWAWRRSRFAVYHLVILAFGWPYVTRFLGSNFSEKTPPPATTTVTVATHNLGLMFQGAKGRNPEHVADMARQYADFLRQNGAPDILCTQETRGDFYKILAEKMGYNHVFNLKKGTVILSRLPMEAGGDIPFGQTSNSTLWANVRLPDNSLVRVYSVHLQSNKVTNDTEKVLEQGDLDDQAMRQRIGRVLQKVGGATAIRTEQAHLLRQHLLDCPYPALVCGDFNDTPNSYVYAHVSEGLTDAFAECGWGLGTTFGGAVPLLRIDYVLSDPRLVPYRCRVVRDTRWTDHYLVWATLGLQI
jgi:endonuclease/exonuclease/phosphatase family metal-dependent hydrolase